MRRSPGRSQRFLAGVSALALAVTHLALPPPAIADNEREIHYFHPDHLGSTALVTNQQGQIVERVTYKPFGEVHTHEVRDPNTGQLIPFTMAPSVTPTPFGFTGQRHDTSTGLYYFHARYYDPQLGRFIQPDTIVPSPGDPQALNRYSYARNNPFKYTDPTGHGWWSKFWHKFKEAFFSVFIAVAVLVIGVALPGGQPLVYLADTLFWKGAAITAGAAASSTLALDTGEGRQLQQHLAREVFDDALGLSPRAAAVAASIVTHAALTWGVERVGAGLFLDAGKEVPVTKPANDATGGSGRSLTQLANEGETVHTIVGQTGQSFQYALVPKQGLFGIIPLDIFGPLKPALTPFQSANIIGWQHVASSGQGAILSGWAKALHGTLKGLCVNEANLAAAAQGLSWTASQAAGATYTTYLAEFVFGTYGNQLPNSALNWVVANHNYHADQ